MSNQHFSIDTETGAVLFKNTATNTWYVPSSEETAGKYISSTVTKYLEDDFSLTLQAEISKDENHPQRDAFYTRLTELNEQLITEYSDIAPE
jgi:hypothetical protein